MSGSMALALRGRLSRSVATPSAISSVSALQRARRVAPAAGVGILRQFADTPVLEGQQMGEFGVERRAAALALAAIASGDQKLILAERQELFGLGARREMAGDRAPAVAPHRVRPRMGSAEAERHALGEMADEACVQKFVERGAVAPRQGDVKLARLVG